MPMSPDLTIKEQVLIFQIWELTSDQHIVLDEKNPKLSYIIENRESIGISYVKTNDQLFNRYQKSLSQLVDFYKNTPQNNQLAKYIWWAWFHSIVWEMQCEGEYEDEEIAKLNEDYIIKLPPDMIELKSTGNPTPPRNLEDAGIVGFFDHIRSNRRYTVIFENTLGYEIRGIDAILKDNDSGKIIFVELKGTSRPINKPLSYLKKTKTKGRQLSWEWIFKSLLNVHKAMAASSVFLYCLEAVLTGKAERWLVITKSVKQSDIWINQEVKAYDDQDIRNLTNLESKYSLQGYQQEFEELKKLGIQFPDIISLKMEIT